MKDLRRWAVAAVAALGATLSHASDADIRKLAAEAGRLPPVVWYESSQAGQIAKVIAAFNKKYPAIKVYRSS